MSVDELASKYKYDQRVILCLKFVRMLAYGQTTMVLVPYFLELGISDEEIGWFMTLTLLGDVVLSTFVAFHAEKWGRRLTLTFSSLLMVISGVIFAMSDNYLVLLVGAVIGVISPSGDEVGPFSTIEMSTLAHITPYGERAMVFAGQNLLGTLGMALGAVGGGWLADTLPSVVGTKIDAYRYIFVLYSTQAAILLFLSLFLGAECELEQPALAPAPDPVSNDETAPPAVAPAVAQTAAREPESAVFAEPETEVDEREPLLESNRVSGRSRLSFGLCLLFGIDSLAYGFMSNSWLVEYMLRTFGSSATIVGEWFSVTTVISALTSLPSAWLTQEIGPVMAIGLTKIGAGAFGALVPFAHNLSGAMTFIGLRSLFDTMDVAPRNVFITSVVPAKDRTKVLGLVTVVKTFARAIGPVFTGLLSAKGQLAACFGIMGILEWVFAGAVMATFS